MASRERVIDLGLGHPGYPAPLTALAAATRFLAAGKSSPYGTPEGHLELRRTLAAMAAKRYGLACDQTWIVVTCGASAGLAAVILALTAPGEGVLVPDPGYPAYAKLVQNLGRVPHRYLAARVDLAPDPAAIEASIRPSDRMLLWNSPSNPLGFVATRAVTETIAEFARRHRLALVSDEVYEDLVYEGVHSSPIQTSVENTVTLHSFSKSYGMAGWRVGYVLALPSLAKEIARAHWSLAMSVSAVGQAAALGALAAPASYLPEVRSTLRRNRDRVCARLSDYGIPHRRPNGAFFVWLDISATGRSAADFVSQCLEENAVALTPGTAFGPGGEGFVRLSFGGAGVELDEGVDRLGHSYREWSGSGALPVAKAIV